MKANEAPEKIYLQDSMSTDTIGDLWPEWFDAKVSDNSIEYIRTDFFMKKAIKYIANHFLAPGMDNEIEDFVNYMKGEQ